MSDSVCNSPARSIGGGSIGGGGDSSLDSGSECESHVLPTEVPGDPDQTIVTGYLKFRDIKRVSKISIFQSNKT